MTKKLLLTIALATVLAVLAAGTAASVDVGGVNVNVPAPGAALPQCADTSDNDGDGAVDLLDPGCSGPLDGDEYNAPPAGGGGGTGGSGDAGSLGPGNTTTPGQGTK